MSASSGAQAPPPERNVIALTGGIGSGKSSVARLLADLGAVVVSADELARAVVQPGTPGFAAVVKAFGDDVVGPDGAIDRERLAAVVFNDDAARRRLEQIVHPLVQAEAKLRFEQAPGDSVLIYELPLLAETGRGKEFAAVVVVDAPDDDRLARLLDKGMSTEEAQARMSAQASRETRLEIADFVIGNSGTTEELARQTTNLWPLLQTLRGARTAAD
jgi:dephospho-CoA kinase